MMHTKTLHILLNLLWLSVFPLLANTDKFYGLQEGLSNSHVNSIYQDRAGLIWICTDNGLNSFDGLKFKTYYHILDDETSLDNNSVLTVCDDTKGNLWVGTTGGLQLLDRTTDRFTTIRFSYPYITDFSYISCIIEDSRGNIWLSTSRAGAICLKGDDHRPVYYLPTNSNICSDKINTIYEDRFGNIWIGSQDNGISVLNMENHTIVNYAHDPDDENSLSSNKVFSFVELPDGNMLIGMIDGGIDLFDYNSKKFIRNYIPSVEGAFTLKKGLHNNIWIGTDGNGLKNFDYKTGAISTYDSDLNSVDMHHAKVHGILEDRLGNLWLVLYQKGIMMIPQQERIFHNWGLNFFHPELNIGTECVLSILEDSARRVWIGTDGDGIYRLNANRKVDRHYSTAQLPASVVLAIFEDSKKRIWLGTYLHGLYLYDEGSDSFRSVKLHAGGKAVKDIYTIEENADGTLWIGTNENGLCLYNHDTGKITSYTYDMMYSGNQIPSNSVHTILFGRDKQVWIGTSSAGISCFDQKTGQFHDYNVENGKLKNNNIYAVAQDKAGNIWVGTKGGLHYIDLKRDTTLLYTEADGLANASIAGIEIDGNGNLWISTSLGLSFYDVKQKRFSNYYTSDGLQNNEFRRGAHFGSKTGELFFGGIDGLTAFYPFVPHAGHELTNLMFTDLYFYNEKIEVGDTDDAVLKHNINATDRIKIGHDIRSFSIEFAALEYNSPEKVIYQVKMKNFDTEWRTLPAGSRLATYTNLNHGSYTFMVRAFLPGTKPVERSLPIVITPPFWLTWWAKTFYILCVLAALFLFFYMMERRVRRKKETIQKENDNLIMQSKLQFLTDISHEIRTPLTLILSPIETLIKDTPEGPLRNVYKLINQNGQRILRLINQVMEMRKLDRGQVRLLAAPTDVEHFFREVSSSFDNIAEEKKIRFSLQVEPGLPKVWIDQEKLDKVVFNVLSNAFKYTPEGGRIDITIGRDGDQLRICIADSGEGIPPEQRELIFNRFYQVPTSANRNKVGTGIGLHLSRSLMEIHHGRIYVDDSPFGGAAFVITLPLDNSYLKKEEMQAEGSENSLATLVQPALQDFVEDTPEEQSQGSTSTSRYKLLVVEDDKDIRKYLKEVLGDYRVIEAEDGVQGLELVISEMPDCVITDVMMPEMDGIELCKKIKTNDKTCHIPVIMLTAKTAIEQRIEGLEVGADSYIPKPFNVEHLRTRVRKLIELRRTIREKYEGKHELRKEDIKIKSGDEKLLEKLEQIVKEQISDPNLSVETISRQIGVSRSQLQRKLKQLTNQNPSDYLKTTRLRYAAMLLVTKNLSISEVTYEAGFSSLSHFSNSFRDFYGMSPSRYVELNHARAARSEEETDSEATDEPKPSAD